MLCAFLLSYLSTSILSPVPNSSALECTNGTVSGSSSSAICGTDTTDVNVSITGAWTVSVSSAGTLGLNLTPTSSGVLSTATDNVNVYTNTPNGYQLYLNSTSGSTDIYNNTDTSQELNHFTATTGTKSSPTTLTNNTWGYSLSSSPTTFSKVELTSSSADSLISSGSKTTGAGDNLPVTYGFMADTKLTPGTYSTQVTYTAIAETPSYTISSISPSELYTNDQTDKTITILTTTPASELGLGDITATITNGTDTVNLTNCSEITSNDYRGATCTFPGGLAMGYYNVTLTSSWHSATYTLTNGFRIRDYRTIANITYMQDMNSDICENTTETTSYASAPTLIDSRGKGNAGSQTGTYKVIKAKDGNCWMADNLNLYNTGASSSEKQLNSTNTDIPSGSYEIPDGITQTSQWGSNIYDRPMVEVAHGLGDYADKTNQYGTWGEVYYNWCAATATS
ncbi:hypothetical protein IKG16_00510, partial [Candidatus Saccharibacteria bacterium]|nr:hypothetical protein [Candidatus Saccharibacteria bacterium]